MEIRLFPCSDTFYCSMFQIITEKKWQVNILRLSHVRDFCSHHNVRFVYV